MKEFKETNKYRIAGYILLFILVGMLAAYYAWVIFGNGF
jgi:hypothetical protein